MSSGVAVIIAALIGVGGSVAGALITTRRGAGQAPPVAGSPVAGQLGRVSRSVWWGGAALVLWIIPVFAYVVLVPGFYVGIRDLSRGRRRAGLGLGFCVVAFVLALVNSAWGAYEQAHGTGWWQQ